MRYLFLLMWTIVLPASLSVVAAESQEDASGKLAGIWEMKVLAKDTNSSEKVYKKIVAFQKVGDSLKAIDLEGTTRVYDVAREGTKVKFPLEISTESKAKAIFSGTLKGGKLTGTTEIDGVPAKWEAAMLASVWVCSNHKPIHTATSEAEMRSLTSKNKCEGWRRMKSTEDFTSNLK